MVNVETRVDDEGKYPWQRIETIFDNGMLIERVVVMDNGVEIYTRFVDEKPSEIFMIDQPAPGTDGDMTNGQGAKVWSSIRVVFDENGKVAERETQYDNGTVKYQQFQDGVPTITIQIDDPYGQNGGAQHWSRIETRYDANGQIAERHTVYDDGVEKYELFENGMRLETVQIDNPNGYDDGGARNWSSITTRYDESGKVSDREIVYDDGSVSYELYENGVRVHKHQLDDPVYGGTGANPWSSIETSYDDAGVISSRITTLDDGVVKFETYDNGVRSGTTLRDNPYQPGGGAKSWDSIAISYDAAGQIESRVTVYDDGRVREDLYENGTRVSSLIKDNPLDLQSAYDWDEQQLVFDENGKLESKSVTYDDGDLVYSEYANGKIALRAELDGDGDEPWLARISTYDEAGALISRDMYFSEEELPLFDLDPAYTALG